MWGFTISCNMSMTLPFLCPRVQCDAAMLDKCTSGGRNAAHALPLSAKISVYCEVML